MKLELVELHQTSSGSGSYLIGYILKEMPAWILFLSIDPAGNQGGIRFIRKSDLSEIKDHSSALSFVRVLAANNQTTDPFTLTGLNRTLLAQNFETIVDILTFASKNQYLVKLTLKNGAEYSGFITQLSANEVRLFTYNEDKVFEDMIETCIRLNDVVEINFNDVDLKLSSEYFSYLGSQGQIGNDLGLAQIYFQYADDFRFGQDMILGWIINQNSQYLLVDRLDDAGQVAAVSLINKATIAHVTTDSDYLNFINFAVEYNQRHQILDPFNLDHFAHQFTQVPNYREIITTSKPNHLLLFDNLQFDGINWGTVMDYNKDSFILRPISDFHFDEPMEMNFDDLCCIDLISSDTIHLQTYLRATQQL